MMARSLLVQCGLILAVVSWLIVGPSAGQRHPLPSNTFMPQDSAQIEGRGISKEVIIVGSNEVANGMPSTVLPGSALFTDPAPSHDWTFIDSALTIYTGDEANAIRKLGEPDAILKGFPRRMLYDGYLPMSKYYDHDGHSGGRDPEADRTLVWSVPSKVGNSLGTHVRVIALVKAGSISQVAVEFGPDTLRRNGTQAGPAIAELPNAKRATTALPTLAVLPFAKELYAVNPSRSYWTNDRFGGFFFVVGTAPFNGGELRLWLVTNRPTAAQREPHQAFPGFDWHATQVVAIYMGPADPVVWEPIGHDSDRAKGWIKLRQQTAQTHSN